MAEHRLIPWLNTGCTRRGIRLRARSGHQLRIRNVCCATVTHGILVRRSGVVLDTPPVERFVYRVSAAIPDPRTGAELQTSLPGHA